MRAILYTVPDVGVETYILDAVESPTAHAFGLAPRRLAVAPISEGAFDVSRAQFESSQILRAVVAQAPADAARVLGVTDRDLYLPGLTFVFGQAQLSGRAAVISVARLRQEFYGLAADRELSCARAATTAFHEIGHTFGLVHCRDTQCVMSLSTDVVQVDAKRRALCRSCAILLEESRCMAELRKARPNGKGY